MTAIRAAVVIALMSLICAGAVALVSRTPASVRDAAPGRDATDPALGSDFSAAQVARAGDYRGPLYLAFVAGTLLQLATLLVLARGPVRDLVASIQGLPGGWPVRTIVVALTVVVILALAGLPLAFVRGYVIQHAWGLSTQDLGGWLSDQLRGLLVSAVTLTVSALAFYAVVRWRPGSWWLWGWGAFTLLTVVLVFLYPVVIAPLFFKFTPLTDRSLEQDIRALAADAGVSVDRVLVADASRRTTAENAYVAGLGGTRRVVVYDTLVESGGERETLFVVAHELGHQIEDHVVKNVVIAAAGLFVGFAALGWLATKSAPWAWAGASGAADLRALPLLAAFSLLAGLILLPIQNGISRTFEAQADRHALALTKDPDIAVRTFRRLAFANIADLDPPPAAIAALYTHPPIRERIQSFVDPAGSPP